MAVKRIKIGGINYDINDSRIGAIDTSLSSSSTNPVQNRVVNTEFAKVAYLGNDDGSTSMYVAAPIEGITMNGDIVTVVGGIADLGTVLTEHQSLAGLATEEYVDTEISTALGDIETLLAAL